MNAFFEAAGRFSVRWRYAILAVWLIATFAAMTLLPGIGSAVQQNDQKFLPSNSPSVQAADLAQPLQPANVTRLTIVAYTTGTPDSAGNGTLTTADQSAIAGIEQKARAVPGTLLVKQVAVSRNNRADEILVASRIQKLNEYPLRAYVGRLSTAVHSVPVPSGLHVHLAGPLASQVANLNRNKGTNNRLQDFAALFIIILLVLIFRAPLAPLLTLLPAFLVVQISGPLIAEVAKTGIPVSVITEFMLVVIVLGAGTDYGLFLVFRVREYMRSGKEPKEAVSLAVAKVGESITFSAATVIAALASLTIASFGMYQSLGIPIAIGVAVMLLAGLTLQPALLAIFGRAAFWPSNTRPLIVAASTAAPDNTQNNTSLESPPTLIENHKPGLWGKTAARLVQHPMETLIAGVVIFTLLAVASTGNKPAGFISGTSAPSGSNAAAGNAALAANFPKAAANPTDIIAHLKVPVWQDAGPLASFEQKLSGSHLFTSVIGPLDPNGTHLTESEFVRLHALLGPPQGLLISRFAPPAGVTAAEMNAYMAAASLVSTGGHTIALETSLSAGDPSSTPAMQAVPAIRSEVSTAAHSSGIQQYGVAGEAAAAYDVSSVAGSDLLHILPLVVVIIALLLIILLRSLVAPLYLIASVVLSYLAALGLAVIIFIYFGGHHGLVFFLPFMLFLFILALGEDYNILVMTRIREEAAKAPLRQAVVRAIERTGTTVTSAGLVLAGTFVVFAIVGGSSSDGSEITEMGIGLALGILMDTFLVRTLLVPSIVVLLEKWNWWPSRHGFVETLREEDLLDEHALQSDPGRQVIPASRPD
ncbi:MAG: MMPL family transporter [Actinobacteria bacterium]|jgi:RND superfamily putative drug exporter|nr:MMPL family transporter [Actinomycetota bacterium]